MKYGVQLYSLRNIGKAQGLEAILKTVADAGYDGVEFAGFYDHTPEEVKALCEKYNLIPYSAHIQARDIPANIEYIKTLGFKIVYTAGIFGDGWTDKYQEQLEFHKKAYEMLKEIGVEFGYHNHAHEYANGQDLVNKITTDVPGMKIEIDLCWATYGGQNVVEKMKEYEGRLRCIHIKELDEGDPHTVPPSIVGEGIVDMQGAFNEAKRQGLEWGVLEVEQFNMPESEYLVKSLANIKKLSK